MLFSFTVVNKNTHKYRKMVFSELKIIKIKALHSWFSYHTLKIFFGWYQSLDFVSYFALRQLNNLPGKEMIKFNEYTFVPVWEMKSTVIHGIFAKLIFTKKWEFWQFSLEF